MDRLQDAVVEHIANINGISIEGARERLKNNAGRLRAAEIRTLHTNDRTGVGKRSRIDSHIERTDSALSTLVN